MSPKIVDKNKKRAEIAAAAMELFARQGFEKTAVREITTAAGMGKGTFYDYFRDKDDILDEIAHLIFQRWSDFFRAELGKSRDPLEQLRTLVKLGVSSAAEFEQMTVIYIDLWRLGVKGRKESPFMVRFRDFITEARQLAAGLIDRARAPGMIGAEVDSSALAAALIALIDGVALHRLVYREEFHPDQVAEAFLDNFIRGLG